MPLKDRLIYGFVIIAVIVCIILQFSYKGLFWNMFGRTVKLNGVIAENENNFYVHFIDVGQAECILLKSGEDTVLIDSGEYDDYYTIEGYLDSLGINQIDYFILSHAHNDHMGSMASLLENYRIDNVIMAKIDRELIPTSAIYSGVLKALSEYDGKIIEAVAGDEYAMDSFSFKILGPLREYEKLNDCSVVVMAYYGENRFLFTGDIEGAAETDLSAVYGDGLSADVLKVAHHGSASSTMTAFLKCVQPKVAVILCSKDNPYEHPNDVTLSKLDDFGVEYYTTSMFGTVIIESDGSRYRVFTEKKYG